MDFVRSLGLLAGVRCGECAFTGPQAVAIEVNTGCNLKCVFCHGYSQLSQHKPDIKREFLGFDLFKRLVDELSSVGVESVFITPFGEPLLHPDFVEMVEYVNDRNLGCVVFTNGTLLDEDKAMRLKNLKAAIRFSLHAGDYESWAKLQPAGTAADFDRIRRVLGILNSPGSRCHAQLFGVITSRNWEAISGLFRLAGETNTRKVVLNAPVVISGFEEVVPSRTQTIELKGMLGGLEAYAKREGIRNNIRELLSNPIYSQGDVIVNTPRNAYDSGIPCTIGWFFSRIDVNGDVHPCYTTASLGNVRRKSFRDIWYSSEYNKLRREMAQTHKKPELRVKYSCDKCCCVETNVNNARSYSIPNIIKRRIRKTWAWTRKTV